MNAPVPAALPVDHYENFPVASWLCPRSLRPAVAAIYWFARTADDIADEGEAEPRDRLEALRAYRADLQACIDRRAVSDRWPRVFGPLAGVIEHRNLPTGLLHDLLSAFEQDIVKTRDGDGYADRAELLDYCRRSANPVGRLMLFLYGITDATALAKSDSICTALQLINFWQDLSVDLPRGRYYVPGTDCSRHGLSPNYPATWGHHPNASLLIADEVQWARATMKKGADLVHRVPGRAGLELRLVVQGGTRILDKIGILGETTFFARPRLRSWDSPALLWRSLWM